MKLNYLKMLFLLGYILCFSEMADFNYRFVSAENFQNFEIEEQLKLINKPAAKIIKTTHGDAYGCVDFYKQPAFDMKIDAFHYEMIEATSFENSTAKEINSNKFGYLWENGLGCPIGTVPIKRVTKDELLRLNSFSNKYNPQGSWNFTHNQSNVVNNHHFAVGRTKGRGKIYNGATMTITVHEPKVKSPQFSSGRMHFQIGNDFIQAGWTVHPHLYSDSRTRNFVFTKAGKYQCFNSMCPGGITLVRSDFPLGSVRDPKKSYEDRYGLFKDQANGKWWLEFAGVRIGFWSANKFQQSSGNYVEWGGEVYTASMPSPQMGNGHFPDGKTYDSLIYKISIVNDKFKIDDKVKNRELFSDNTRGYRVLGNLLPFYPPKPIIYYGGPGNI